ncbi:DUF4398 domain-containing protein [Pseudomonas sp. GOM7]|uniref:DUF4398 domain-containing protein n=1 Tax=unclassified Pseudomonas TaxID=196821 RepID=UPI00227A556C|nr:MULTISPECIES: DUF4398 domain-containing protein [unclassified Pseudomonas]WAJ35796.1 DUF4398 domain-containing protein [Pseudomonas sp. GOM7]
MIDRYLCRLILPLALAGCASDPAPTEQLRLTEQALSQVQALAVGAEQAPLLAQAEDKYARARIAAADEDNKEARLLAEQAELDARLAEAEHLNVRSREQLTELNRRIARLRQQLGAM